jgi:hypothetical protein
LLPDGRRVVFFTSGKRADLVVVDSESHRRTVIPVQLPAQPFNDVFSMSPDGKRIYYGAVHEEADIWIAERR